ncbi:NUDIX hydrolase [Salinilacihabitans rarus]|uniref:NUDIX hydrolase n=1 Tax=Salinilacihabitans rarus TaxID=2961596 RepID=UPI0020C93223|nr:NUDIX domain-containing protein [Salinilacihabitans rarus]
MSVDELTLRADQATRRAADLYRRLEGRDEEFLERERSKQVSRRRFSALVERIRESGTPYGAHTIVYRPTGEVLLVRHEGVDMWVLPGGRLDRHESALEGARRELAEEAGVDVSYDGLAILTRIDLETRGYRTWGVLPIFEARAETTDPEVDDPDGEISAARWFETLPADTRDREDLLAWRRDRF